MNERKESYLLLRGVRIPEDGAGGKTDRVADVLIRRQNGKGVIREILPARAGGLAAMQEKWGENFPLTIRQENGSFLLPTFVDSFCSLCDADYAYREDPESYSAAALAGGFTDLLLVPQKRSSAVGALEEMRRRFDGSRCRTAIAAGVQPAGGHGSLCDPQRLRQEGYTVLTDAGGGALPDEQMYSVMKKAAAADSLLLLPIRCDPTGVGQLHEGRVSRLTGVAGIDPVYGLISLSKLLLLAGRSGCRIHIPVVSSRAQLLQIRRAKADGVGVTCGTTPAYFSMTEDDVIYRGAAAKLDPPLQTESDREAILEGLRDGSIDCICSGHSPLSRYEKQGTLTAAKPGASMLEAVFTACVTYLLEPGLLTPRQLQELLSAAPARILGLPARKIAEGEPADLCLTDLRAERIFDPAAMKSKSANLPYLGMAMRGSIRETLLDGTPVA